MNEFILLIVVADATGPQLTLDAATLIPIILSAGGGAFVLAIIQGWRDMRAGARAGQRETVQDLMNWRDDLDDKLHLSTQDTDFWRDVAAQRGYQLRQAGIEPAVPNPVPPSARQAVEGNTP